MTYIIIIVVSLIIIGGVNSILVLCNVINNFSVVYAIFITLIDFIIMIGIEGLVAYIIHKMPSEKFSPYRKKYLVGKKEIAFYDKIKIHYWKRFIPDTGQLCDFKKDKLKNTKTDYLYRFLVETCYADTIHKWMGISGFLMLLLNIIRPLSILTIGLPIAIISLILNILPSLLQRYNRPKLLRVYEYNLKKETKNI